VIAAHIRRPSTRAAHAAASHGISRGCAVGASFALTGCERAPSVNVLGAFFPSWMLCILVGIALTLVVRQVLAAAVGESWISPLGLVYPALTLAFTLATWLTFFRG
jgi:urea transporter